MLATSASPNTGSTRIGFISSFSNPQFFVAHKGKRLRLSQNDTDFFDTDAELAPATSVAESNAIKLPPQSDVLN